MASTSKVGQLGCLQHIHQHPLLPCQQKRVTDVPNRPPFAYPWQAPTRFSPMRSSAGRGRSHPGFMALSKACKPVLLCPSRAAGTERHLCMLAALVFFTALGCPDTDTPALETQAPFGRHWKDLLRSCLFSALLEASWEEADAKLPAASDRPGRLSCRAVQHCCMASACRCTAPRQSATSMKVR